MHHTNVANQSPFIVGNHTKFLSNGNNSTYIS